MSEPGAYDLPSLDGIETPEQADELLNKINAAAYGDPEHHPYLADHIQHADYVARVNQLWKIKLQDVDPRPPLEVQMEAGLQAMEQQHQALIQRGEDLMAQLVEAGYEGMAIPDDLLPFEADCLESQLLASRGEWDVVTERLSEGFRRHSAPGWVQQTFSDYQRTPASSENEKLAFATTILRFMVDAERKKLGLEPRNRKGDTK